MSHTVPEQAPPQQDRSIPWRRILAEGAVIVASILLALAGDAWWGGVQDRQDERALAESLLEEFLDSRPGLEERVLLARRMAAGNATLLEILDPEAGDRTGPRFPGLRRPWRADVRARHEFVGRRPGVR